MGSDSVASAIFPGDNPPTRRTMLTRERAFEATEETTFDAAIIGGGIAGAAVFRELCQRGHRVLLVDRGDFTAGTSQASGMLIWGGLLYLKNLDLRTVFKLSAARDSMLDLEPEQVQKLRFRYLPLLHGGRSRLLVSAALYAYWLIGQRRRHRPYSEADYPCLDLLCSNRFAGSLVYEEAGLTTSDSRFALGWITGEHSERRVPINHCALRTGHWNRAGKTWELELEDQLGGRQLRVQARTLINAGGVWADRINESCGLESEYRHVFSKGVYVAFRRPPELDEALVFEMGQHGDSQTFTPWGPVALWGPTETALEDLEQGFAPTVEDVRFLLEQANRNLRVKRGPEDIVSLRCGVRPLAVKRSYRGTRHPLELSRRHVVARDAKAPAVTLYGGKITSAPGMAREVADVLAGSMAPRLEHDRDPQRGLQNELAPPTRTSFPGLAESLPDPAWCVRNEGCATLEDYLRRRTNLSQWIPRLGLGASDEHEQQIEQIAQAIHGSSSTSLAPGRGAAEALAGLRRAADQQDQLLGAV